MRITQNMLSNNVLNNLNRSYQELDKYFNQLNTGKKINRPSDDPVAAMQGMNYRTTVNRIEQYKRNTNELHNWYDSTDAALEHLSTGVDRIRYLATQANNGTYGESELQSIAEEVKQIKLDLLDVANTKVNDKYIFNGTATDVPPIKLNENNQIDYNQSGFGTGNFTVQVSSTSELTANVYGSNVFGALPANETEVENSNDMFSVIDRFIEKLESGNVTSDFDESLGEIIEVFNRVVDERAGLGARMNRLELVENRLDQQEIVATSTLSKNEDVDYAEAITKLITQQSIHRAALSSGSQIIQPTLLDFLR